MTNLILGCQHIAPRPVSWVATRSLKCDDLQDLVARLVAFEMDEASRRIATLLGSPGFGVKLRDKIRANRDMERLNRLSSDFAPRQCLQEESTAE